MSYKLRHFVVQEFVPPDLYEAEGDASIKHVDERMLVTMDDIRDFFGVPVIINNWHLGKLFKNRGFRTASCKIGAKHSLHKLGQAIDFDVFEMSPDKVRSIILENQKKFLFITRMERDTKWVHIDCKSTGLGQIIQFNPL